MARRASVPELYDPSHPDFDHESNHPTARARNLEGSSLARETDPHREKDTRPWYEKTPVISHVVDAYRKKFRRSIGG